MTPAVRGRRLPRSFYARDVLEVAPELLNKVLVCGNRAGRIVEVEAYRGGEDPASHAYKGPTARNASMFGPPGRLYVYFTYGMHWCANVVCMPEGTAQAILLRALSPLAGLEEMRAARPAARRDRDLCRGPARLCQALGIDRSYDGADLVRPGGHRLSILDDGADPPAAPGTGERIGIRLAQDRPWRWWVPEDPNLSRADPIRS
ncbi:MAG: DNA-3-methyladenine glycosylase [Acidimicrobiales bacterium]